jgi:hypothetical protein
MEYYVVLYRDSSKCRDIIILNGIIRNYHTDRLVTGNNHQITCWWHDSLSSSQFVEIWEYLCNMEYSVVPYMETVLSAEASKLLVTSSAITIRTGWSQRTITRLLIGDMIAYYHPSAYRFENIGVLWRVVCWTLSREFLVQRHQHC